MPRFFIQPAFALLAIATGLYGASCTKSSTNPDSPAPASGKAFYSFTRANVGWFEIVRQFPGEEPWRVAMKKDEAGWKITSAPAPVRDPLADGAFVDHLLDTFLTLAPLERARAGDAKSYGLDPPRARIRFGADEKGGLQLELGDEVQPGVRFARFAPDTAVMLTQGATLHMLKLVSDWQFLRRKVWVMGTIDDVDVVRAGAAQFEREGLDWRTAQKRIAPTLPALLENLFHQRVKGFVDAPAEIARIEAETSQTKPVVITLLDRRDKPQTLETFAVGGNVYGRNSKRPGAWVELHPEIRQTFSRLTQAASTPLRSGTK